MFDTKVTLRRTQRSKKKMIEVLSCNVVVVIVVKSCLTHKTPWTGVHRSPLPMGLYRQEYWSGLAFSSPGIFPTSRGNRVKVVSYTASGFLTAEPPIKYILKYLFIFFKRPCSHLSLIKLLILV